MTAVRPLTSRAAPLVACFVCGVIGLWPAPAGADGGSLRLSDVPVGPYRMAVFSDPTPLRPDSVDISVIVLDPETRLPVWGLEVGVAAVSGDQRLEVPATRQQADDPERYYAAKFALPVSGSWTFRVAVSGEGFRDAASFTLDVREAGPLDNPWVRVGLLLAPLAFLALMILRRPDDRTPTPDGRAAILGSAVIAVCLGGLIGGCRPQEEPMPWDEVARIVAVEDERRVELTDELVAAMDHADPRVRALAVRGLARHERSAWLEVVERGLFDPDPEVRASAANAVAQAARQGGEDRALEALTEILGRERHPRVRSAVAHAAGRLGTDSLRAERAEAILLEVSTEPGEAALFDPRSLSQPGAPILDLIRGALDLARASGGSHPRQPDMIQLVESMVRFGREASPDLAAGDPVGPALSMARIRRAAVQTLSLSGATSEAVLAEVATDGDPGVRAEAVRTLRGPAAATTLPGWFADRLDDPAASVRVEALRSLPAPGAVNPGVDRCDRLRQAASTDSVLRVRLVALDLTGAACGAEPETAELLRTLATPGDAEGASSWHLPAHAGAALARSAPDASAEVADYLANHDNPFARAWGARILGLRGDGAGVLALTADSDANVRTQALRTLAGLGHPGVVAAARAQLDQDDPQLLMTAAGLLESAPPSPSLTLLLLDAASRLTAAGKETDWDARAALLRAVGRVGSDADTAAIRPYLEDYEPRIAAQAEALLSGWGAPGQATPRPFDPPPPPTADELERMTRERIVFQMAGGGRFVFALRPLEAPTNAARLARLARAGTLDGLTFHRVEPGFVVQGPSPGANEYAGHGAYSRDEVTGAAHWRGTVGLSTRGRDTGDGQIFVNLADNLRLDYTYTLLADVVEGMDVVDGLLEGDVIDRVTVTQPETP